MARRVEDFVSNNNRGVGRLEGYLVDASDERALELSFSGITCMVRVSGAVYERDRGDHLLVGSTEPEHGIGRGGIGTEYGEYMEVTEEGETGVFTVDGRATVVDSLRGIENGIHELAVGTGDEPAVRSDEELDNETERHRAWTEDTGPTEVTVLQKFSSVLTGDLSEAGVIDRNGRLMGRLLFGDVGSVTGTSDYRVEVTLRFESQTLGDGYITDVGLEAITDSVSVSEEVAGIDRAVIGTSDQQPAPTDTTMGERLDDKAVERHARSDSVSALTVWFEDEPAGHPHSLREIGLEDNQGRLIWRTVFDTEEKTDDLPVIVDARIRII
ncbi:hypothetical protein [Natronosalvus rutilus]|uniref:Uncharacterized protein n=1 Tax=Natronosalvus rutilus TaxID=2953753 RepID=A0A9E7SX17_9EURY|nr:hypothetical protein [Natronosalvus rutilus]UTF55975.1 hypothetical protein NGM29_21010 [Natronosalvus rutilus]